MFGTPEYQVRATVVDDKLSVRVTAVNTYGSRSVTRTADVTLDEKDADKVKAILTKAIESATVEAVVRSNETNEKGEIIVDKNGSPLKTILQVPLSQQIFSDAAECLVVATKKGEEV